MINNIKLHSSFLRLLFNLNRIITKMFKQHLNFSYFYKYQKITSDMSYKRPYNNITTYFLRTPTLSNETKKGYLSDDIAFFVTFSL